MCGYTVLDIEVFGFELINLELFNNAMKMKKRYPDFYDFGIPFL